VTSDQLRSKFLEFFRARGHKVLPSSPLVPSDPTTLFTTAGMQQFVPAFRGEVPPPAPRVATVQKCLRIDDLDEVGRTARHDTFFEMLGNFSFGDYFKREAILWAWEFATSVLGMPAERIWVTIYPTDDEARAVWRDEVGVPEARIVSLEDNWWPSAGGLGPCGPDSELHYDVGPEVGCGRPNCKPGCDCDRFQEFWNLVFQQYNRNEDGSLVELPTQNIDTGMGLERLSVVMQGVTTIFDTDLFRPLIARVEEVVRRGAPDYRYGGGGHQDVAVRIIADHARAITFLIADGVTPSNEGRGYVLRRLIRRSARLGRLFAVRGPFLVEVVPAVVARMQAAYPELAGKQEAIRKFVRAEEERFSETLEQGTQLLERVVARAKAAGEEVIPGGVVFELYDTFGFPLELTVEMAAEEGLGVDQEEFARLMEEQRARARAAGEKAFAYRAATGYADYAGATEFTGYQSTTTESRVVALVRAGEALPRASAGEEVEVILDRTPFYAERGGQVGDQGTLTWEGGAGEVLDTYPPAEGVIAHRTRVTAGTLEPGMAVTADVDAERRAAIARAHSATHLLHHALRHVLGEHAAQAGSLVEPDRLRFDFSHFSGLTPEEIAEVERLANRMVLESAPVDTQVMELAEARERGAIAIFGEKYGNLVRVVRMGNSVELCGGTHVGNTVAVGLIKITTESSVGAGLRRVEAVTGMEALRLVQEQEAALRQAGSLLRTVPEAVPERIRALQADLKAAEREIARLQEKGAASLADELAAQAVPVDGIKVLAAQVPGMPAEAMRTLADALSGKLGSAVIVLGTAAEGKVSLVAVASKDLVARGVHAGNLVREVARLTGGGGGGRPDFAQAGGRDPDRLPAALAAVPGLVRTQAQGG